MKVIVTCGPGYEPIDDVRRITNFSTGELGVRLANRLAAAGCEVTCFRGVAATTPLPLRGAAHVAFTTTATLREALVRHASQHADVAAVFHAAALSDFRVSEVRGADGKPLGGAKISSRHGALHLTLAPVGKLIAELRGIFPHSLLVGWKYELVGDRETALVAARAQIAENSTDACVLNGTAYGPGFGFCTAGNDDDSRPPRHLDDKEALSEFLAAWLRGKVRAA